MEIVSATDKRMTIEEALSGIEIPDAIRKNLVLIDLPYVSFDGTLQTGQIVIDSSLAEEVKEIFFEISLSKFPIKKIVPVAVYDWNDEKSMEDNNTSAFNYRHIIGTNQLSHHAQGRAIDINPLQNPYFAADGNVYPSSAIYDPSQNGTLDEHSTPVKIFKKYGWKWLGERKEYTDYQHFEKPI